MSDAIKPVAWKLTSPSGRYDFEVIEGGSEIAEEFGWHRTALYDQATLDAAIAAERDCRTCRNFSTHSGGCVSVLRCTNANAYQRAGFRQYWETTPEDAGF